MEIGDLAFPNWFVSQFDPSVSQSHFFVNLFLSNTLRFHNNMCLAIVRKFPKITLKYIKLPFRKALCIKKSFKKGGLSTLRKKLNLAINHWPIFSQIILINLIFMKTTVYFK